MSAILRTVFVVGAALSLCGRPASATESHIRIRVSYKVIVNPVDGNRPPGTSDEQIDRNLASMNTILDTHKRGYRFVRTDPIRSVGAAGDPNGPGKYYNDRYSGEDGPYPLYLDTQANPFAYGWSPGVINIYINNWGGGCGSTAIYGANYALLPMGPCLVNNPYGQLQSLLRTLYSVHPTQGGGCLSCATPGQTGVCFTVPGDDFIADTLPDLPAWNQDDISNFSFGIPYASLSPADKNLVDDTYYNIASFHGYFPCGKQMDTPRLTERQLDAWGDRIRTLFAFQNGAPFFVDRNANPAQANGSSRQPFATVAAAAASTVAQPGDFMYLRPGYYNERLTISKPLTLRGTRAGDVIIGKAG